MSWGEVHKQRVRFLSTAFDDEPVVPIGENIPPCCDDCPVYASLTDNDPLQNDFSAPIKFFPLPLLPVVMKLQKDDEDIAILVDDTFGTWGGDLREKDGMTPVGYVIQWQKVLQAFGAGAYKLAFAYNGGITYSPEFCLKEYSPLLADGTVRATYYRNSIIGDRDQTKTRDFTGLNWPDQVRICNAIFGFANGSWEKQTVRYNSGFERTFSKEYREEYELIIRGMSIEKHKIMRHDWLNSDLLTFTDYTAFNNSGRWAEIAVEVNSAYKPNYLSVTPSIVMGFIDAYSNRRKLYA